MRKISDSLRLLVMQNPFLQFGLYHHLLNITQLAKYLRPQLQARTGKDIQDSAIAMNLSRMQRDLRSSIPTELASVRILNLNIRPGLIVATYPETNEVHSGLQKFLERVRKKRGYVTLTRGVSEIGIITEIQFESLLKELVAEKPAEHFASVAGLGIKFDSQHIQQPGLFYTIFQLMYFQQITVLEITSAGTELTLYLREKDVQLAFDTVYQYSRREVAEEL